MRWWQWVLTVLVVGILIFGSYSFVSVRNLEVEQLDEDLYVLYGLGGNVAVLSTDEGAVIVDTMTLQYQGDRIKELATELTGKPVIAIINTHYHLDHTHGNPAFDQGTRVISTARTLHHLKETDHEYFSGAAAALLPNETFEQEQRLTFGNKTLRLVSPGRGHTDGDLVVVFEQERVIHMGDLLFNQHYPNIDLEAGGTVRDWAATLDATLALSFDRVIPGHGEVTDREGIKQFQQFMNQLSDIGEASVVNSTSLEETIQSPDLTEDAGYQQIHLVIPTGLTREFVLRRAWEEANGVIEVRP
jgi:glyoxylase-like metal-dependent hydrolase (beta-lactamase superfamily II)